MAERRHRHSHSLCKRIPDDEQQHANGDPAAHESAAHIVRPVLEVAALHQRVEDAVLDAGEILVELILQRGKLDVGLRAIRENTREQYQFMRFQACPFRWLLFQVKHVLFVRESPSMWSLSFSSITR